MIPAKQRCCLAKQTEGLRGNAPWREPGVVYFFGPILGLIGFLFFYKG